MAALISAVGNRKEFSSCPPTQQPRRGHMKGGKKEDAARFESSRVLFLLLDLLHVTPRLWQAAHVFHAEGSQDAEDFVRDRVLRVLHGKAAGVCRGLREMATKRGLAGAKKRTITTVCNYLEANLQRMRYDEYLKAGYPIATGVVEGACRHLVKD